MITFDGASQYAMHSATPPAFTDLSLAVWFRTTTAAAACLLGCATGTVEVAIRFNAPSAGKTQIKIKKSGTQIRTVNFTNAAVYDGASHHLLVTRSGSTVVVYLAGAAQSLTTESSSLTTQVVNGLIAWALGALNSAGTTTEFAACSVGEYAFWKRALTAEEAVALAAGISPLCMDSALQLYWDLHSLPSTFGGGSWTNTGVFADFHPAIIRPSSPIVTRLNPLRFGGYDVHLTRDRPAVAGDLPLDRLPNTENAFTAALADLPLGASAPHFLTIIPFTAAGHGEPLSRRFVTDGDAAPEARPSLVTRLRVAAGMGGSAKVAWHYEEPVGGARADTFSVEVLSLDGAAPIAVADVSAMELRQDYATEFSGPDGAYRVKIYSKAAGLYEPVVTGVDVVLDGTAPVGVVPEMTAV